MLHTINDKPYITFEKFGDFQIDFNKLLFEVQNYMILSNDWFHAVGGGLGVDHWGKNNLDLSQMQELVRYEDVPFNAEDNLRKANLDTRQQSLYDVIVKGLYTPWTLYDLNGHGLWPDRKCARNSWFPDVHKHMPYFVHVTKQIPIIKHFGWGRIYANHAFNYTPPHQDFSPNIAVEEFLYVNLNNKATYIADGIAGNKTYIKDKCVYFDAANWHGTDPEPRFNFALRLDCVFTEEFRQSLKYSRPSATT